MTAGAGLCGKGASVGEHPNVGRARVAIERFNRGDLDEYIQFFAEDVVWHVGGNHALSGDYRGRNHLHEYFEHVRAVTAGSLRSEPQAYLADDAHVGVFSRVTGRRASQVLDVALAQAFRVSPTGEWTEYWAFADDQAAVDRFWSGAGPDPGAPPRRRGGWVPAGGGDGDGDMTRHPNAVAARHAYEALNDRDFGVMARLLADDALVHNALTPLTPTLGRAEFLVMMDRADRTAGGTQRFDVETVFADGRYVMSFLRARAQRPGRRQDVAFVVAARLDEAGHWTEMWYGTDDVAAVRTFWAD